MKIKQFHIYTTDGATVEHTTGDLRWIDWDISLFYYSLYDIEEIHAMAILDMIKGVRAEKKSFFAAQAQIEAYCKVHDIFPAPWGAQKWAYRGDR